MALIASKQPEFEKQGERRNWVPDEGSESEEADMISLTFH